MSKKGVPEESQFVLYISSDGQVKLHVFLKDETVWLTQQYMAELFQTTKQNISLHIKAVKEGIGHGKTMGLGLLSVVPI